MYCFRRKELKTVLTLTQNELLKRAAAKSRPTESQHLAMTSEDHAAVYVKGRLAEAMERLQKADRRATELGMTARAVYQRIFKAEGDVNEAQKQRAILL
eukprot:531679-Pleurochrysis_carterae.AAC.1